MPRTSLPPRRSPEALASLLRFEMVERPGSKSIAYPWCVASSEPAIAPSAVRGPYAGFQRAADRSAGIGRSTVAALRWSRISGRQSF